MCGIAGYIYTNLPDRAEAVDNRIKRSILYRGRDAQDEWGDGQNIKLFHARLSIIDLLSGQQPMHDINGRFTIVFNGEIYNYKELRLEYEKSGARFQTQSDTEVILEGYKLKGGNVCKDLNGMFAFAIWDKSKKELFLARDRLGKKPLVWCNVGNAFYFSSTLDSFRDVPGWSGELSQGALWLYSVMSGFPEDQTVYHQAYALPPASYATVSLSNPIPRVERYWRPDYSSKSGKNFSELLDEYEDILTNAVAIRLRSDVPIALTFSGGVDSGTIAAICAKKLNTQLVCHTIDYHTDADQSPEVLIAQQTAAYLGLPWNHIQFDYHDQLLRDFERDYSFYDQPCIQMALVYSQSLYEAIKPYATVVLSGNGSDELFTGYIGDENKRKGDIERDKFIRHDRKLHRKIIRFLRKTPEQEYKTLSRAYIADIINKCKTENHPSLVVEEVETILNKYADEINLCGVNSYLDLGMHIDLACSTSDSNYRLPDISGLAAQVEVRSPFLDYRLVEFAARLPHQYKVGNPFSSELNKYLPKKYYERFVPHEIAWSSKKGMGYNLRWHISIAHEAAFLSAFQDAYDKIDAMGLDSSLYRRAWMDYRKDILDGIEFPPSASVMMSGFMFGGWLSRATS